MGQFRVGQKGVKWDKKRCRNCVRTINGRKKSNIHMGQFSAGTKIGRTKSVASWGDNVLQAQKLVGQSPIQCITNLYTTVSLLNFA